jgi:cyclopropane-fatty-acyl-phospholipid synthase
MRRLARTLGRPGDRGILTFGTAAVALEGRGLPASPPEPTGSEANRPAGVAEALSPLLERLFGGPVPFRVEFWDGTGLGRHDGPGVVWVRSTDGFRRLVWTGAGLGLGRAFVAGDVDVTGDLTGILHAIRAALPTGLRPSAWLTPQALTAIRRAGGLGRPLPPPAEEARPRGWRHSVRRDAKVISHHYDVGNDFYRLVLGPAMTYSCALFADETMALEEAQAAKHDLICRKLGLHERTGLRLLDVGCGWGSMAMHAAARYDAEVVGITISGAQAELARRRVADAGLDDRVQIRLQDYRDLRGETFDAISSVGMFEHVGTARAAEYFERLRRLLVPTGRLLNHAISTPGGSRLSRRSFMYRYAFPDAELCDVGDVVLRMEAAGLEVRDVEGLREHYARTLRAWMANLEANWARAVAEVGLPRVRAWRLYMAAAAAGFDTGHLAVHQVLGVVPGVDGRAAMPATRHGWTC